MPVCTPKVIQTDLISFLGSLSKNDVQYPLGYVVKGTFGLWEVPVGLRADLKFATTITGALFVMITLDLVMLELLVDNLDSLIEV